jgi:hypothetical protein
MLLLLCEDDEVGDGGVDPFALPPSASDSTWSSIARGRAMRVERRVERDG